jgi:hypothetical protein
MRVMPSFILTGSQNTLQLSDLRLARLGLFADLVLVNDVVISPNQLQFDIESVTVGHHFAMRLVQSEELDMRLSSR